jgi:hypothetical protein
MAFQHSATLFYIKIHCGVTSVSEEQKLLRERGALRLPLHKTETGDERKSGTVFQKVASNRHPRLAQRQASCAA